MAWSRAPQPAQPGMLEVALPVLGAVAIALLFLGVAVVFGLLVARWRLQSHYRLHDPAFLALGFRRVTSGLGLINRYVLSQGGREVIATLAPPRRSRRQSRPAGLVLRVSARVASYLSVSPPVDGQAAAQTFYGMHALDAGPAYAKLRVGTDSDDFARSVLHSPQTLPTLQRLLLPGDGRWSAFVAGRGAVGINVQGATAELLTTAQLKRWLDDLGTLAPAVEAAAARASGAR